MFRAPFLRAVCNPHLVCANSCRSSTLLLFFFSLSSSIRYCFLCLDYVRVVSVSEKMPLCVTLHTATVMSLFEKHCMKEFSTENLEVSSPRLFFCPSFEEVPSFLLFLVLQGGQCFPRSDGKQWRRGRHHTRRGRKRPAGKQKSVCIDCLCFSWHLLVNIYLN